MSKLNTLLVVLLFSLVVACSRGKLPMTNTSDFRVVCLEGVNYYLFVESQGYVGHGFMSPKFNKDGSLSLCEVSSGD